MDDSYLSISFKVYPNSGIEILIAELSLLEFELFEEKPQGLIAYIKSCLLYTSPSPRDLSTSRMPSSA